jgi:hypothetical protein
MTIKDENKIIFEYRWIFTPETEPKEEDKKYRKFLKRMYLENVHPTLVLKKRNIQKNFSK